MRWGAIIGVGLLAISIVLANSPRQEKENDQQPQSSIARAQWQDVQHPNHEDAKGYEEKEDETDDQYEQARRVRVRNGAKRRRRLRKRPRTTTPSTGEDETVQEDGAEEKYPVRGRWSQEDSVDYLPVDGDYRPYRRRPGKRRRRPLRKQQYAEETPDAPENQEEESYRRRRKGYRKRIRGQEEEGAQNQGQDHKKKENHHSTEESKTARTETSQTNPVIREEVHRQHVKSTRPEESVLNLAATRRHNFDQQTTTVRSRSEETQIHDDFRQLIKNNNRPLERQKDKAQKQDSGERKESRSEAPSRSRNDLSKEKVFDRKTLFSNSRRLPQTSAVIRRRLRPKNGTIETNNLVPKGYDKQMPEIIPPYKLIEEMMSTKKTTTTEQDSSEEPNYPKIHHTRIRLKETTPRASTNTYTDDQNVYTTIEEFLKVKKEPSTTSTTTSTTSTTTTTTTTTEKPELSSEANSDSLENFNIAEVEDHILDLLLSKNSSSRLSKILELRNMTLIQLIQHRERGSSQLHFSGVFNKSNGSTTEKQVDFINDDVKNYVSEDSDVDSSNLATNVKEDSREPRIFDSLPNFDRNSLSESRTQSYPTWSVIPNPDLTPMSVNTYDRSPAITRATVKPLYNDNIEDIILIDDNNVERFPSSSFNLNLANKISDGIKTFKKFPPGVKSAIIVSLGILVLAIIGFLSVLISCRVRQKRSRLRAKRDVLNEQLHNEEFMNSQRSLSPVLSKNQPGQQPSFTQGIHSNTSSNRHYYLWRTLRKTFQYD